MIAELATRLDEQYPGWAAKIDLGTLNMADSGCCVIGQGVTDGNRQAYTSAVWSLLRQGELSIDSYFLGTYETKWRAEIEARRN